MTSLEGAFLEEENAEKIVGQNDLRKLKDVHFTAGVREGIDAGKESTLQDGFNCGYKEAFFKSHNTGKLRGVLSAILSYTSIKPDDGRGCEQPVNEKVKTLLSELTEVEAKQTEKMKECLKDMRSIPQENTLTCNSSGTIDKELNTDFDPQLTELWDKCRHLCNELGIDIQKLEMKTQCREKRNEKS